jgi:hypothetical protein
VKRLKVAPAIGLMWLTRKMSSRWRIGSTGRTSLNFGRKIPVATNRISPEMKKMTGRINAGFQTQKPREKL